MICDISLITDNAVAASATKGVIVNLITAANTLCAALKEIEDEAVEIGGTYSETILKEAGATSDYQLSERLINSIETCTNILTIEKNNLDQINWKAT